ncbi:hypothetical protein SOVF_053090 [Spinacia oleracea]|nr:hypothetical protein SOVF_053090 [Spinacia oleracea]
MDGAKNAAETVKTNVTEQTDKIDTDKISKTAGEMAETTKTHVGDALEKAGDVVKPEPPKEESLMDKAKGLFK